MDQRTGPDVGILGEEGAIVCPFACVAVDRPAFAELRDGEAVEEIGGGASNVGELAGMQVCHALKS